MCESIIRREEEDHDAFMEQRELSLKMPSDLDFLTQYLAIENYLGFGLYRNPFVIPALDKNAHLYADSVLDLSIDKTVSTTVEGAVMWYNTKQTRKLHSVGTDEG